jgi:hypothetical protein
MNLCYHDGAIFFTNKETQILRLDLKQRHVTLVHQVSADKTLLSLACNRCTGALLYTCIGSSAVWQIDKPCGMLQTDAASSNNSVARIVAGSSSKAGCNLGQGAAARMGRSIVLGGYDGDGNVVLADFCNNQVLLLSPTGMVSLLAGDAGGKAGCMEGPANSACFKWPYQVSITMRGDVLVCDSGNRRLVAVHAGLKPPSRAWRLGFPPRQGELLGKALLNEEHADVHFEVEGEMIPAHATVRHASNRINACEPKLDLLDGLFVHMHQQIINRLFITTYLPPDSHVCSHAPTNTHHF